MDSGEGDRRLRDIVALSTLPAIWHQAEPHRVAESLAAALFATVSPRLIFVALCHSDEEDPAVTVQVGRNETDAALAKSLRPAIFDWARNHDPEDYMRLLGAERFGPLSVTARPIGLAAEWGVVAAGVEDPGALNTFIHLMLNVAATQAATAVQNMRLLESLHRSIAEREQSQAEERRAREEVEALENVSRMLAGELDLEPLVQSVTDAATRLSGAKFGAFFYNTTEGDDESYVLYTLSGAPREAFEKFGLPRNTPIFEPTFRGSEIVRFDDVLTQPRYGTMPPHYGMPKGHLPVRSYLAVPVRSRSGEVIGGLFLGHPEPGVFTDRAERLVAGIAGHAAIAFDNARLFGQAQEEIAARRQHEEHQKLLLDELNHRVKNTLATVQSIAMQTLKGNAPLDEERQAFQARLASLAEVHDLLTETNWEGADLRRVVLGPLAPFDDRETPRYSVDGPNVRLAPRTALTLGMAFHELATNAAKYGALSNGGGQIRVVWKVEPSADRDRLRLRWTESGGPPVAPPRRQGFGSLMIQRGLAHDLGGEVQLRYDPAGVNCTIDIQLP